MEDISDDVTGSSLEGMCCLLPITEQSNSITSGIDVAPPREIVRLLYETDRQIFGASTEYEGILSEKTQLVINSIIAITKDILQNSKNSIIVLAGCGTSGRLAFMAARSFNEKIKQTGGDPCFEYLIAGGDGALFVSQELSEDNPTAGRNDLEKVCIGKSRVLYIGITCGLSAAYVASQLDYCMQHLDTFTPVLIGFNQISLARDVPVEGWDKTFLQIARELEKLSVNEKGFILNPLIGPEPITGSTRMKCGTATKMMLEAIFIAAYIEHLTHQTGSVLSILGGYRSLQQITYENVEPLAKLIEYGGSSLNAGGHIYYISKSDSLGVVALIDASECTPTYGASMDDVRGFIAGGFPALANKDGDLSHVIEISAGYFQTHIIPNMSAHDLVVILAIDGDVWWEDQLLSSKCTKVLLSLKLSDDSKVKPSSDDVITSKMALVYRVRVGEGARGLPRQLQGIAAKFYAEIACKWTCNVLTTGAHILRGKIYENYMVDVRVSNNKLFHRAVGIVAKFGKCSTDGATVALLKSIYETDYVSEKQLRCVVSEHIVRATNRQRVVAVAILLASQQCPLVNAQQVLREFPIIRLALLNCLQHQPHQSSKS